jgi:S-formylglutathione hydrolase FrmB
MRTLSALLIGILFQQAKPTDDPATWRWNVPDAVNVPGLEHATIKSASMNLEAGFNIYLPPGYKESSDRYPVVYFLHGMTGTEKSEAWLAGIVHKAIADRKIPPTIAVFPNGGYSSFYLDWAGGKVMAETMLIKELIPHVDATWRTIASREGRAICGFSMGGYGSMRLSFKYPDLFSSAVSIGGAVSTADRMIDFRKARGTELEKVYREGDPWALAKTNADRVKGRVALRLYVGDKDGTFKAHAPFVDHLKSLDVAADLKVLEGVEHNPGQYFPKMAVEMLEFQAQGFKAAAEKK